MRWTPGLVTIRIFTRSDGMATTALKSRYYSMADVQRRVLGIDIDIRPHNRAAIETHPMSHRIDMIQGSSIAPEIIAHSPVRIVPLPKGHAQAKACHRVLGIELGRPLIGGDHLAQPIGTAPHGQGIAVCFPGPGRR